MPDSLTLARQFREALLRRDAAAQAEILRAYTQVWVKLSAEIERVVARIQEQGNTVSLLFEEQRLRQLQEQLATEINEVARVASAVTVREQTQVIELAREHLQRLMRAAAGSRTQVNFAGLAKDEIQHLVGVTKQGSPLSGLFRDLANQIGVESGDVLKHSLIEGMALGQGPKAIAARVRRSVDGPDAPRLQDPKAVRRLQANMREQVLGAYRETTRLGYDANSKQVAGWVWTARRSPITCVVCWAMDGTVFPAGQPMISHITCYCVMRPLLRGQSPGESGADAFAQLERGVQKSILGDLGFRAYEDGLVDLGDFVGVHTDEKWGDSRFRRGLSDIIGKAQVEKLRKRVSGQ